jgi:peptidoglycan hydrolase-like protein with peptidoglycan-binding domain
MKLPFRVFRVMTVLAVASVVLLATNGGAPAAGAAVPDAAPGVAATARPGPWKTLRTGDREYRVASVRCLLEQFGFYRRGCRPLEDRGDLFHRGMVDDVQRYQRARRVRVTGRIDPPTWEALSRDLRLSHEGDRRAHLVRGVQYALKVLHRPDLRVDGHFGPLTKRAVQDYQRRKHIRVDGIAGKDTFKTMFGQGAESDSRPRPRADH